MLTRTPRSLLLKLVVVGLPLGWIVPQLLVAFDVSVRVSWATAVLMCGVAVVVVVLTWPVRQWTASRKERPVDPLRAASAVVLARTGSRAGALFAGWFVGHVVMLLPDVGFSPAYDQLLRVGAAGVSSCALMIVGYMCESWCKLPPEDGGQGPDGAQNDGAPA